MNEALIFETGRPDASGVDVEEPGHFQSRLGPCERNSALDLPGLTEPEAVRHYVRLSRNNYSIDAGIYPLGSCTMKHNPRLNEKLAQTCPASPTSIRSSPSRRRKARSRSSSCSPRP